ncbi:hypothetical protein FQA39_LY08264 [Lamprigera yunnana]|nr:hypothetical protein FQA39_LY08264 [Lamprigera yunnana]
MIIPQKLWLFFLITVTSLYSLEARKIRVRPVPQEPEQEDESVQYYSAEPRDEADARVVYVASADQYNGLFGQPTSAPRNAQANYIQQNRETPNALKSTRTKDSNKTPPVQTIRNYNKVNDDGSFTFGYEAADGSFKEETRGTDCVVRGKYGYIDPDGNKREFTYVSGNPCDPNAPKEEEDELPEEESNEPENVPANYPTRPIRPIRPEMATQKPAVTVFQNTYSQPEEEEEPEPEQLLKPQIIQSLRPQFVARPQVYQHFTNSQEEIPSFQRSRVVPSSTPASVVYKQSVTPINITPRPLPVATARSQLPPTTYRPQLLQVAVTPRPTLLYTKGLSVTPRPSILSSTPSSVPISVTRGGIDFESEFQRFQQDNNISPSPTPLSFLKTTPKHIKTTSAAPTPSSAPVYSSELVFDPVSGLYNTQLYQTLPQTEGDFSLNHRIQPYVHQPQQQLLNIHQLQQQSPLYRALRPQPTQTLYQQQQSDIQFQNSAQLFAQQQQQRAKAQQAQQVQQAQQSRVLQRPSNVEPQQIYYIQPSSFQHPQALVGGSPIDAFLRGQNIQF